MGNRTPSVAAIIALIAALALPWGHSAAWAEERAAVLTPLSGPVAVYGQAIAANARAVLGSDIAVIDDGCQADTAASAARIIAGGDTSMVIGMPCVDAFDAAMPIFAEANVAVLAVGIQAPDITTPPRGAQSWPVFRVGPPATQEADVLAAHLAEQWRETAFAIIDDGTLYGRQLAETVRLQLEERALEPVFTDTYRPLVETQAALVRRLRRAGATHALIGGDARDAAVIAADAERLDYDLALAGGAFLLAPPDDGTLPDGTLIAAIPPDLDLPMIAAQIARQALNGDPVEELRTGMFDTDIGTLSFGGTGEVQTPFYRMHTVREGTAVPLPQTEVD